MNPFKALFGSIIGALIGVAALIGSFPLHFWNENRAVQTERSLEEGEKVMVRADAQGPDNANEGRLVYLGGEAKGDKPIVDPVTKFSVPALVVERKPEMYQWEEHSHTSGSGSNRTTTYEYKMAWLDRVEDSERFHVNSGHRNPGKFRVQAGSAALSFARLGGWQVPEQVLREIDAGTAWVPEEGDLKALPATLHSQAKLSGAYLHFGRSMDAPQVGDERVRFEIVPPGPISMVARQVGSSVEKFQTSNGRSILLVEEGSVSPEMLFQHAFTQNTVLTWILRAVGTFVMFVGFRLMIEPLTKFTDWIPFIGGVVDSGATLASGVLAICGSMATVAVAWFVVRPLLSVGLVGVIVALVFLFRKRKVEASARIGAG